MENQTHQKIIEAIQNRGPSLPVQLAKDLSMNSLFISAFLSELSSEKKIKVSHLRVGGSPLYFLEGQEEKLEPFHTYLPQREIEAFQLLKTKKILEDAEQEPAIRVALRSIRDFAIGFKKDDEIYWRYSLTPEEEIEEILTPKKPEIKIEKKEAKKIPEIKKEIIKPKKQTIEKENFQNPIVISEEKSKKQKPQSEFVQKTINLLNQKFKILEEKDFKAKEYNCIIQANSDLGAINFLTQARDKKSVSELDVKNLLSDSQKIPLPALLLYTGNLSKKAKEYIERYNSIIKAKKII